MSLYSFVVWIRMKCSQSNQPSLEEGIVISTRLRELLDFKNSQFETLTTEPQTKADDRPDRDELGT
jgi:hypothetical protein